MAYSTTSDYQNPWGTRIHNAVKKREAWEERFKCSILEEYYEGFQWRGSRQNYDPYVVNMVYSTIKIKIGNLLIQQPNFIVDPAPGAAHWDQDFAVQSAQIKQDVLNAIIHNPNAKFTDQFKLAALDSFFRFGLIEVGYAADWRNPRKVDAELKSWTDGSVIEDKDTIVEDIPVLISERLFVKRINPKKFVCAISAKTDLEDHDWCGYCDYYYTAQLKNTKGIKWPSEYAIAEGGGIYQAAEYTNLHGAAELEDELETKHLLEQGSLSKVWHIFDKVGQKRLLILDSCWEVLWEEHLERIPLIDLRWDFRTSGFYPIPPVWQWLSPQNTINETREAMRSHRKRFTAKFQVVKGLCEEEEKEKFVAGPDGVLIEVKEADAIRPIQNPNLDNLNSTDLTIARDEFNIVSGTSADARGQDTDRTTATQSKIIQMRAQIRESVEQIDFKIFYANTGRQILVTAKEKMVSGLWIKYSSNPSEGPLQDMVVNRPIFKFIASQQIDDDYDFFIRVDIQDGSPAAMLAEREAYVGFVSFLAQFPMVAMSPALIRETAYRFGYRNEMIIHQMQQVAVLALAAKTQQAGSADGVSLNGGSGTSPGETLAAQQQPPSDQQVDTQISQQLM